MAATGVAGVGVEAATLTDQIWPWHSPRHCEHASRCTCQNAPGRCDSARARTARCGACARAICPRPAGRIAFRREIRWRGEGVTGRKETYVLDKSLVELVASASFGLGVVFGYVLSEKIIFFVGEFMATVEGEYMRWRSDGVECYLPAS